MMDPEDFVRSTMRPMAEYTFPYITSVVAIIDSEYGEHIGSGLRCILRGEPCLVTAKHIIDEANGISLGAGFVAERGAPPSPLEGLRHVEEPSVDLAIYFLKDVPDHEQRARFWLESRIDPLKDRRSSDFLFVHGFPGARSRFAFGLLNNRSLPYGVMERDDDLPADARQHEFGMDYDPNTMFLTQGGTADLVDPHGLSGSPVWRIGASGRAPEEWTTSLSLLVGIVTRWNHDKRVLLAIGADALLDLVKLAS